MITTTLIENILENGPVRVVRADGTATTPELALKEGLWADTILVRDDGWSLGAPTELRGVAESLWSGDWVLEIDPLARTWAPYRANGPEGL